MTIWHTFNIQFSDEIKWRKSGIHTVDVSHSGSWWRHWVWWNPMFLRQLLEMRDRITRTHVLEDIVSDWNTQVRHYVHCVWSSRWLNVLYVITVTFQNKTYRRTQYWWDCLTMMGFVSVYYAIPCISRRINVNSKWPTIRNAITRYCLSVMCSSLLTRI